MEQFDRENSANYVSRPAQPEQSEETSTPTSAQPSKPQKPKKSKAPLVLTLLLLLALATAGVFGWLWYQQNREVNNVRSDLSMAKNKISQLESAAKADAELQEGTSNMTTDTSDAESDAVVKAALAYMTAPVDPVGDNSREAKVEYLKGDFAKVVVKTSDVSPGGMGASVLSFALTMKKSSNDWIVLSAAEGPVSNMDELMKEYGIPREAF